MTDGYPDNKGKEKTDPIDEKCTCTHKKSNHCNFTYTNKIQWHPDNHGECTELNCNCKQFTWAGWIYK